MADNTGIQWTDATWNPVRGCTRVSPGCGGPGHAGGCYAEIIAARFSGPGQPYHGFAERGRPGSKWTGKVALIDHMLTLPLRWKKPRRIFVNSMSDLFHEDLPDEAINQVFAIMALCPQHTFQVLTKRAKRMRDYLNGLTIHRICATAYGLFDERHPHARSERLVAMFFGKTIDWWRAFGIEEARRIGLPLSNVWLGVSVEDQARADERIPDLLKTRAAVRFVSAEPLLGPVTLDRWIHEIPPEAIDRNGGHRGGAFCRLDWLIVGGESGTRARPMHPNWARSLRDQCAGVGVPFFFKQWGAWAPHYYGTREADGVHRLVNISVPSEANRRTKEIVFGAREHGEEVLNMRRAAAHPRLLDGREHNEFPRTKETVAA